MGSFVGTAAGALVALGQFSPMLAAPPCPLMTVDGACRPLVAAAGDAEAEPAADATACPLPAFPGAEGFGMYVTGGRGGAVVLVTSPDNSGPGTLRWAIEEVKGPRTILFAVRKIHLEKNVKIKRGNVTIAGSQPVASRLLAPVSQSVQAT